VSVYFTHTIIISFHIFFFKCYLHHRDLHSFPTRRSSDLPAASTTTSPPRTTCCMRSSAARRGGWPRRSTASPRWSAIRKPGSPRSEEHTSELQSPCNLVCRLLLEKKKKKKNLIIIHKKKKTNTIQSNFKITLIYFLQSDLTHIQTTTKFQQTVQNLLTSRYDMYNN